MLNPKNEFSSKKTITNLSELFFDRRDFINEFNMDKLTEKYTILK